MSETQYTFKKAERLCSKKIINDLFVASDAYRIKKYPLVLVYTYTNLPAQYPAQILISVGKKYSKKAVHRNLVKRQLRELYRTNKHQLYSKLENKQGQIALLLLFVGREKFEFQQLKYKFDEVFTEFISTI